MPCLTSMPGSQANEIAQNPFIPECFKYVVPHSGLHTCLFVDPTFDLDPALRGLICPVSAQVRDMKFPLAIQSEGSN